MPAVIEVISLLEKVAITKELLEVSYLVCVRFANIKFVRVVQTTRLGKHVNELRRNTTNESLAKRAKELVKKWRSMVLPESNGQVNDKTKKRPARDKADGLSVKRPRINGQTSEFEFSDNSNSSFKDVISPIAVNSDSNSSLQEKHDPAVDQQLPKKRGRKKGSTNHKNLIDEAETSFTNKMAVSRGNAKVKTTQELVASLQNKNCTLSSLKPIQDLNERAAKLTERVSIIDQKLNTNSNRYKKKNVERASEPVIVKPSLSDDEVIIVDEVEKEETEEKIEENEVNQVSTLSIEEIVEKLPPIDVAVLDVKETEPQCTCELVEDLDEETARYRIEEDGDCPARRCLEDKYGLLDVTEEKVRRLHSEFIPNVNGNYSTSETDRAPLMLDKGLFKNVVPNVNEESIPKDPKPDFSTENFKKYSISDNRFREWHEVVEATSYDGEVLKILPYVIID